MTKFYQHLCLIHYCDIPHLFIVQNLNYLKLNYLQPPLLKFHKNVAHDYQILYKSFQFLTFSNQQEEVVKSLDTITLKLALRNI